jgi:septal ring factor EnvC (AmiA/AmiB activator)
MNNEVETIEAERRAQQPAVKALEAENKELERRMQIANKQHGTLQSQIRCLKQDANTVSDAVRIFFLSLDHLEGQ